MARLHLNSLIKGMSGSLGNAVLRKVGNTTIISGKPKAPRKQSEQQRINRQKFKAASWYAKEMLKDPQKRAYYLQKAKKLKLPNAYTAAVTEYMRKGEIKAVDTRAFTSKPGGAIKINVHKKAFAIHKVRVTVFNAHDEVLETRLAEKLSNNLFIFKASAHLMPGDVGKITVALEDHPLNVITKEVRLMD